jgi:DNA gyrase inhibitor GyrI
VPGIDVCAAVDQDFSYLVVTVGNGQVEGGQSVVLLALDVNKISQVTYCTKQNIHKKSREPPKYEALHLTSISTTFAEEIESYIFISP